MSFSNSLLSLMIVSLDSDAKYDGSVMFEDKALDTRPAAYGFASSETAAALLNSV
jgi:ABC-type uncharacterized transport system YnjBCD ATPase subunit